MSTGLVILAAGESSRLGEPKQLLAYRGTTLLQHAIEVALAVQSGPVIVVLGAHAEKIRAHLDSSRVTLVENPAWAEGIGGSLRSGLRALLALHPGISAALFMLCDQPLVTPEVLRELIATHTRTGHLIVASEYHGTLGVPALFAPPLFPELLALAGPAGARPIIQAHRAHAIGIPFPSGTIDIDTPDDYARLRDSTE